MRYNSVLSSRLDKKENASKTRNEKSELLVVWVEGTCGLNPLGSQGKLG